MLGRVAVFGDIGGHAAALFSHLVKLGMNSYTLELPDDLTVIQVGDLVHRGPNTGGVLQLVEAVRTQQPDKWHQLVGNHEAMYLPGGPEFHWPEVLNDAGEALLNKWWDSGWLKVAVGVDSEDGELLITHAGLTAGAWRKLRSPATVKAAVDSLNKLPVHNPDLLWSVGAMISSRNPVNFSAGPVWAEAGQELYGSWLAAESDGRGVPFGQVHGHSSVYSFDREAWREPRVLARRFMVNHDRRHVSGLLGGKVFYGIDPDLGQVENAFEWEPLLFENATVIS